MEAIIPLKPTWKKLLSKIEAGALRKWRRTIVVTTDMRPWYQLKKGEHWALDVDEVDGEYVGHWRVTTCPRDKGVRPVFPYPVLWFYFASQEDKPQEVDG